MLAASLVNFLDTATITDSSHQANYPASLLADPALGIVWKTTATGDQWVTIDYGSPKSVAIAAALAGNFTTIRFRANATNPGGVWSGTLAYDATLTLGECPGCGDPIDWGEPRYNTWVIPTVAQTYRYNQWLIPSQATTDGAAYYRLGYLYAGAAIPNLRNIRWDYDPTPTQATEVVTAVGGSEQESILGPQKMRITGTRQSLLGVKADGTVTPALLDDGVSDWMAFERQWKVEGKALIIPRDDHPYWVGMMRLASVSGRKISYPADDVGFEWRGVE